MARVRGRSEMIGGMEPELRPERFVFVTTTDSAPAWLPAALATFREDEGLSAILPLEAAGAAGLPIDLPMRCITLTVNSALEGVGLTAAVAGALAGADIACNMVAAYHHDHAFIPEADAERALGVLKALQAANAG